MTTLRKKKEFKKSLKKQNNKASQKKLRKRSKNKISKKRLVTGSKLGGSNDANRVVLQRVISGTRDPDDIYKVLLTIGQKFVYEYNLLNDPKIELRHRGTRISPKDGSVYLTIQFASPVNGQKFEIFHLSDHPGISTSLCGAIHIKQLSSLDGLTQYEHPRCFTITTKENNKLTLINYSGGNGDDRDFKILKSLIENITEQDVIDLGLYTRPNKENLPHTPVGQGTRGQDPNFSTETHPGSPLKNRRIF